MTAVTLTVVPYETEEQQKVFQWAAQAESKYPELKLLYAIPNGSYRHKKTAGILKAEGVKPGVCDIHLPVARGGYHGLYIEMKRKQGGKVSKEQFNFMKKVTEKGYFAVVCKGAEQAIIVLKRYFSMPETKVISMEFERFKAGFKDFDLRKEEKHENL